MNDSEHTDRAQTGAAMLEHLERIARSNARQWRNANPCMPDASQLETLLDGATRQAVNTMGSLEDTHAAIAATDHGARLLEEATLVVRAAGRDANAEAVVRTAIRREVKERLLETFETVRDLDRMDANRTRDDTGIGL